MGDRRYHHGDLAAALLARAEQTLHESGIQSLSLRGLARDVGVSPAAPNRHYKSKQALLNALAVAGFQRLAQAISTSQRGAGDGFAERLDAAARAYVDFAVHNAALLDLMFSTKHDTSASADLGPGVHQWSDQLLKLIADGQRRGEVRPGPLERMALPVVAALHGYAGLVVSRALPQELAEQGLDDLIDSLLRGCAP